MLLTLAPFFLNPYRGNKLATSRHPLVMRYSALSVLSLPANEGMPNPFSPLSLSLCHRFASKCYLASMHRLLPTDIPSYGLSPLDGWNMFAQERSETVSADSYNMKYRPNMVFVRSGHGGKYKWLLCRDMSLHKPAILVCLPIDIA